MPRAPCPQSPTRAGLERRPSDQRERRRQRPRLALPLEITSTPRTLTSPTQDTANRCASRVSSESSQASGLVEDRSNSPEPLFSTPNEGGVLRKAPSERPTGVMAAASPPGPRPVRSPTSSSWRATSAPARERSANETGSAGSGPGLREKGEVLRKAPSERASANDGGSVPARPSPLKITSTLQPPAVAHPGRSQGRTEARRRGMFTRKHCYWEPCAEQRICTKTALPVQYRKAKTSSQQRTDRGKTPMDNPLSRLHQFITDRYDLEDLRTLCFDLGMDYDSLRGEGKEAKARELLLYLARRGRLEELLGKLHQERPALFDQANLSADVAALKLTYRPFSTAPRLPVNFVPRPEELKKLRNIVAGDAAERQVALTSLRGMGGIGKTIMAIALCHDEVIQAAFPDGIIWIKIGRAPGDLVNQMREIGKALGDTLELYDSPEGGRRRLSIILRDKAALIVLDDVWYARHVKPFWEVDAPRCCLLFTTRDGSIALGLGAQEVRLDVLKPDEAVTMLQKWAERDEPALPDIAERLGYLPLALKLAGAQLRDGMSGAEWLETFRHVSQIKLGRYSTDPEDNLQVCFDLSTEQLLEKKDRLLYYTIGIFPEDIWIPQHVVMRLWQQVNQRMSDLDCKELVTALERLALIDVNRERAVTLHDLLYDYTRSKLGDCLQSTHNELLTAYNPDSKPWYEIAHDGYLYYHLPYHMIEAGRKDELYSLLTTAPVWMEARFAEERDMTIERLILSIWERYWQDDQEIAHGFITKWLSRRSRRTHADYTPKFVAVRCAFYVGDDEALALAVRSRDERVRSAVVTYIYFRYRQDPNSVLDNILEPLATHTKRFGIPNVTLIRTILETILLLLIFEYPNEGPDTDNAVRLVNITKEVVKDALLINSRILRPVVRRVRTAIFKMAVSYLIRTLTWQVDADEGIDTVVNINELERFFEHIQEKEAPVLKVLPYYNRGYGDLADAVEDVIAVYDRTRYEIVSFFPLVLSGQIMTIHGIHDPDKILPVVQAVFGLEEPEWREERQIHIIGTWREIMLGQNKIEKRWLDVARDFARTYYDNVTQGYGVVVSPNGTYQYYPMAYYSQIWNRLNPNEPVDLVRDYLQRAEQEGDKELIIHILRGFGDPRAHLLEYRTVLEHLTPYLVSVDRKIKNVAIGTVARLRSTRQEQVDDYLATASIPHQDVVEEIKELSHLETFHAIITRQFGELVITLLAFTPPQGLSWLFDSMNAALSQDNVRDALNVFFDNVVNLLERDEPKG
jgi:hypothetical protein